MFYGLNNLVKKILPKGLFYRSLIIVATPIILLQVIITVVFFDSLWIKANKGMTRSLVSEVKTLYEIYQSDQTSKQEILDTYNKLGIPLEEQKMLANVAVDAVFDSVSVTTTFKEELQKHGVIFCSFSEAVKNHPNIVKKYLNIL